MFDPREDWVSMTLVVLPVLGILLGLILFLGLLSSPIPPTQIVPIGDQRDFEGFGLEGFGDVQVDRWVPVGRRLIDHPKLLTLLDVALRRRAAETGPDVLFGFSSDGGPVFPVIEAAYVGTKGPKTPDTQVLMDATVGTGATEGTWFMWKVHNVGFVRRKILDSESGLPDSWVEDDLTVTFFFDPYHFLRRT
jgi:hypothetical protein